MNIRLILGLTMIPAILVILGVAFWSRMRVRKIAEQYKKEELGDYKPVDIEFKGLKSSDLSEDLVSFIVNTIVRNKYKSFFIEEHKDIVNSVKTILTNTDARIAKTKVDLYVHEYNGEDFIETFDNANKKTKDGGMIVFLNFPKKEFKKIANQEYISNKSFPYEWQKLGGGLLIIAKHKK